MSRGICTICGREAALTPDGLIRWHGPRSGPCPGSSQPPRAGSTSTPVPAWRDTTPYGQNQRGKVEPTSFELVLPLHRLQLGVVRRPGIASHRGAQDWVGSVTWCGHRLIDGRRLVPDRAEAQAMLCDLAVGVARDLDQAVGALPDPTPDDDRAAVPGLDWRQETIDGAWVGYLGDRVPVCVEPEPDGTWSWWGVYDGVRSGRQRGVADPATGRFMAEHWLSRRLDAERGAA